MVQIAAPGTDTSKAKVGDLVTLSFTASEALQQSPTCTFKSGGASVSGSATTADGGDNDAATWSCSYTAQSTDTAGNVSFCDRVCGSGGQRRHCRHSDDRCIGSEL